jgi:hypothetical protein
VSHETPKPRGGPRPPRSRNAYKLSETVRAMKAAEMARIDVERYDINPRTGTISIVVRGEEPPKTELDEWVAKRARPA